MGRKMIIFYLLVISIIGSTAFAGETIESVAPVMCSEDIYSPVVVVSSQDYPCPGGVYCEHYRCGEAFCCPWGYFYSNPCTCLCYKSSYDAGRDCDTYFRCN